MPSVHDQNRGPSIGGIFAQVVIEELVYEHSTQTDVATGEDSPGGSNYVPRNNQWNCNNYQGSRCLPTGARHEPGQEDSKWNLNKKYLSRKSQVPGEGILDVWIGSYSLEEIKSYEQAVGGALNILQ